MKYSCEFESYPNKFQEKKMNETFMNTVFYA